MKRKGTYYLISVVTLCILLTVGCKNKEGITNKIEPTISNTENVQPTDMPNDSMKIKDEVDKEDNSSPTIKVIDNKEISIYSINSETIEKEAVTALVSTNQEITPQLIVDLVVDAMADEAYMIGIDSVTTSDDKVIVSFLADQPPVKNVGSSAEGEILDAIAQSLLDNLMDYNKVIFRIMNEAYITGHFEFDLNYIYMER